MNVEVRQDTYCQKVLTTEFEEYRGTERTFRSSRGFASDFLLGGLTGYGAWALYRAMPAQSTDSDGDAGPTAAILTRKNVSIASATLAAWAFLHLGSAVYNIIWGIDSIESVGSATSEKLVGERYSCGKNHFAGAPVELTIGNHRAQATLDDDGKAQIPLPSVETLAGAYRSPILKVAVAESVKEIDLQEDAATVASVAAHFQDTLPTLAAAGDAKAAKICEFAEAKYAGLTETCSRVGTLLDAFTAKQEEEKHLKAEKERKQEHEAYVVLHSNTLTEFSRSIVALSKDCSGMRKFKKAQRQTIAEWLHAYEAFKTSLREGTVEEIRRRAFGEAISAQLNACVAAYDARVERLAQRRQERFLAKAFPAYRRLGKQQCRDQCASSSPEQEPKACLRQCMRERSERVKACRRSSEPDLRKASCQEIIRSVVTVDRMARLQDRIMGPE